MCSSREATTRARRSPKQALWNSSAGSCESCRWWPTDRPPTSSNAFAATGSPPAWPFGLIRGLSMSLDRWAQARNILCVRLDSLGDVLMTTPAIRALRESGTGRRITLLTSQAGAEIGQLVPEIDEIIAHEAIWMKHTPERSDSSAERRLIDRLRAERFDAAVIFTVFSQNPLPA